MNAKKNTNAATATTAANKTAQVAQAPKTEQGAQNKAPQPTQTTMTLKAANSTTKTSVQMGHTNRRRYYLYAPGKGFVVSAEKGLATFGVGGDVASYGDMRMVKFVKDFFVNTLKITDELLVMTVVA